MCQEHWRSRNEAVPSIAKGGAGTGAKATAPPWHRSAPPSQKRHKSFVFKAVPVPLRTICKRAKLLKYQRYHRHRPIEKVHTLSRACARLPLHVGERGGERHTHVELNFLVGGDSGKRWCRTGRGFRRLWLAVEIDEESAAVPGAHALAFHGIAQGLASLYDENLWLLRVKLGRTSLHAMYASCC
jgi:hypothetical protein